MHSLWYVLWCPVTHVVGSINTHIVLTHHLERYRLVCNDGIRTIEDSITGVGVLEDKPFIIRMLLPDERVDKNDEAEFEAVDCNNRVVAMLKLGIKTFKNYLIVRPQVDEEQLTWQILELITCSKNYLHDAGSVQATPWEKFLRVLRLAPRFGKVGKKRAETDYVGLLDFLVCTHTQSLFVYQVLLSLELENIGKGWGERSRLHPRTSSKLGYNGGAFDALPKYSGTDHKKTPVWGNQ
jgi:hypothetical protein